MHFSKRVRWALYSVGLGILVAIFFVPFVHRVGWDGVFAHEPEACLLYGVQDSGGSDSTFFRKDLVQGDVSLFGPEYSSYDIEALGIHPITKRLYAIAGGGGSHDGQVFLVDTTTGVLTAVGSVPGAIDGNEIQAASFHLDGSLWAAMEESGLVKIIFDTAGNVASATPQPTPDGKIGEDWEGLAWDLAGNFVYGAHGSHLYRWNPTTNESTEVCTNLPSQVEALEFRQDGVLLAASHNRNGIYSVNVDTCSIQDVYQLSFDDIESLAFASCATQSKPAQLSISKTVTDTNEVETEENSASSGETMAYTITVRNTGDETARSVTLEDVYPESYFIVTDSNGGTAAGNGKLTYSLGDIKGGKKKQIIIFGHIADTTPANTEFSNIATARSENTDPVSDTAVTTVVGGSGAVCDLTITKSDTPDPVAPGAEITYTIHLKNNGQANCTGGGVELKETYDQATTFVSADPAPQFGTNRWNFGTVSPGEEHTITVVVRVADTAQNNQKILNTACVWAKEFGPKSSDISWRCDSEETTVKIPSGPFLVIEKVVTDSDETKVHANTAERGALQTYTITVTNTGESAAQNVQIIDQFNATFFAVSNAGGGVVHGNEVTYVVGTLAPGASVQKDITGIVASNAAFGATFKNTARTWANGIPEIGDEANTTIRDTSQKVCQLSFEKTGNPATVAPSGQIIYTLKVTNTGTADCTQTIVREMYDSLTQFQSAQPAPSSGMNEWSIGTLTPEASQTVQVIVTVSAQAVDGDTLTNDACVWSAERGDSTNTSNWVCDTAETTVDIPDQFPALLMVTKKVTDSNELLVDQNTTIPGAQQTYTLIVHNTGSIDARDVILKDSYPEALLTAVSAGNATVNAGTATWSLGTLEPGRTATTTFIVQLTGTFTDGQEFVNTATASGSNAASVSDTAKTLVHVTTQQETALTIEKRVSDLNETDKVQVESHPGENVTYAITVTNTGSLDAVGVTLVDNYNEQHITPLSLDSSGTNTGLVANWNLGVLAPGQSKTVHMTARIHASTNPGTLIGNTATADADNTLPVSDTANISVVALPGQAASVGIDKTVSVSEVKVNENVEFKITVTNTGAIALQKIPLKDTFNAVYLQFISASLPVDADSAGMLMWNDITGSGSLAPQAEIQITVTFKAVTNIDPAVNTAKVSGVQDSTGGSVADAEDSANVKITRPPTITVCTENCGGGGGGGGNFNNPYLKLEKRVDRSSVSAPATLQYTLVVTNTGDLIAKSLTLTDQLPNWFVYPLSDLSSGDTVKTRSWSLGDLAPLASTTVMYTVVVPSGTPDGVYENIAKAAIVNGGVPGNRAEARATVTVGSGGGGGGGCTSNCGSNGGGGSITRLLTIQKAMTSMNEFGFVNSGMDIEYRVVVTNTGYQRIENVVATDTLPSGFTFVETGGSSRTWPLGALNPGESKTLMYMAHIADSVPAGFYTNEAVVTGDGVEPRRAEATTEVRIPKIAGMTLLPNTGVAGTAGMAAGGLSAVFAGIAWMLVRQKRFGY